VGAKLHRVLKTQVGRVYAIIEGGLRHERTRTGAEDLLITSVSPKTSVAQLQCPRG
jgi:hypothetical protein